MIKEILLAALIGTVVLVGIPITLGIITAWGGFYFLAGLMGFVVIICVAAALAVEATPSAN